MSVLTAVLLRIGLRLVILSLYGVNYGRSENRLKRQNVVTLARLLNLSKTIQLNVQRLDIILSFFIMLNHSNCAEPIFPPFFCGPRLLHSVTSIFPILVVLLLVPQPNIKQVSPAMTIFDKLTANSTAKTRMFDSNFDFYDTPDAILTLLLCTVAIT